MNDNDLRQRLKAADPATPSPADSWIPDLVEATMNTPLENDNRSRSWLLPLVAAAAVAVLAVGGFAALNDDDPAPVATPTSVTLTAPPSDAMGMCMVFDPAVLKEAEIAFSGTVEATDEESVTLDVDRWYQGGDADQVILEHSGAATQVALDGVAFEDGKRYLVSASDDTVRTCGYSGPWTEEFAAQFDQAFGS